MPLADRIQALIPKPNIDKSETSRKALKLMRIPELKEDFSNFEYWHHALWFHLEYYGLRLMVTHLRMNFPHGLYPDLFDNEEEYQLFNRHKLHAYSLVFSKAANVVRNGPSWPEHYAKLNFCPCQLMDLIEKMKDFKIAVSSPAYEGYA